MTDFVSLTCPSCGGRLKITKEIERFACAYCGAEHIVKRGEGVISLAPVVEGLEKIRSGVDKTASELAISRLQREITELERQLRQVSQARLALLQKMRMTWEPEIALLRFGLGELMKSENPPQKTFRWQGLLTGGYSDKDYSARFQRLTMEDSQFLVRACQKPRSFGAAASKSIVKSLGEKLALVQREAQIREKLERLRAELAKHEQIVCS